MFHHRKHPKEHPSSSVSASTASAAGEGSPLTPKTTSTETHRIPTLATVAELDEVLADNHHRFVVVFCLPTSHKEPGPDADGDEGWFHHYERLNNMHFVRVYVDESEELEARLSPRTRPSWITFHRGHATGASSGGMKRFIQAHTHKQGST